MDFSDLNLLSSVHQPPALTRFFHFSSMELLMESFNSNLLSLPLPNTFAYLHFFTCLPNAAQEVVVGITTGQVLCACVDSKTRAEYTVYGTCPKSTLNP